MDLEIIPAAVAGCSFATSAATIILVIRCNDILRAADAAIDLLTEQNRLLRRVLWSVPHLAFPPQTPAEKPIVTDSDTK